MSVSAAYIVGPLAGGKLADPELVSWFNYATPFWTVMILLAIVTGVTAFVFIETNPPEARHAVSYLEAFTNLAGVVSNRRLRALYWFNFSFTSRSSVFFAAIRCIWSMNSIWVYHVCRSSLLGWGFPSCSPTFG
jgi:hypothetical protein